jgi:hypothetical protein
LYTYAKYMHIHMVPLAIGGVHVHMHTHEHTNKIFVFQKLFVPEADFTFFVIVFLVFLPLNFQSFKENGCLHTLNVWIHACKHLHFVSFLFA